MKTKANIGIALVITFAVTLIIGIILHFKGHGIVIQPRGVLKTVHWIFGYAMTALLFIHWSQFSKMLNALKKKFRWFYAADHTIRSHAAHRYDQDAFAGKDFAPRIVALWGRHSHEHYRIHTPHTGASGME